MLVVQVGWEGWQYCTEICKEDTNTPRSPGQLSVQHGAGSWLYSEQPRNIWKDTENNGRNESLDASYWCQGKDIQGEHERIKEQNCFCGDSLLPTGGMHDMSTAASVGANRQFRRHEKGIWGSCPFKRSTSSTCHYPCGITPTKRWQQFVIWDWPSALLIGIFPLHCVNTVDLWTHAVSTMAWAWAATSCSSWQRMQVSTSLSAGVEPLWGPTATHISICSIAQLEEKTQSIISESHPNCIHTYVFYVLLHRTSQQLWHSLPVSHSLACCHKAFCLTLWSSSALLTSGPLSSAGGVWLPPPSFYAQLSLYPEHSGIIMKLFLYKRQSVTKL